MSFYVNLDTTNIDDAMVAANHDFHVEKRNIQIVDTGIVIPDHMAILDVDHAKYLGTVGSGWEPVQPRTIYELAQELLSSTQGSKINGAFTMNNGAVIGVSFQLAQREYVAGDPTTLNFIMVNAFNGTHGIAGHATTYRNVSMSRCNTSNKVYTLKHTKNVANRLEVVKEMIRYYNNEIARFDQKMMSMVQHRMTDNEAVSWFRELFPVPKSERAQVILTNQESTFIDCLHHGRGSDIPGVKGTCYGAFQALVEYINHYRSTRVHNDREEEEVKFQSVHFGSGNTLTQKGLVSFSGILSEFHEDEFMIQ